MGDISWEGYLFSQPDSAFHFAQLQYEFAIEKDEKEQIASALNTQAISFAVQGNHDKAMEYYLKGLKIDEELGDKAGIATSLNNIGLSYSNTGKYDKALEYYSKGLKLCKEIKDQSGIADALSKIGLIYSNQGHYNKAIEHYKNSIEIDKKLGNKKSIGSSLNNIGLTYQDQGNHAKAIESFTASLKIAEEVGNQNLESDALVNIGVIYRNQENDAKALEFYKKGLKIKEELGDKSGIAIALINIGGLYYDQNNKNKALEYFNSSLKIAEEINDKSRMAVSLNNIGTYYKDQKDYDKAKEYYSRGLEIVEENGDNSKIAMFLKNIGTTLNDQGLYKKALRYGEQSLTIAQEIGQVEMTRDAAQSLWISNKKIGNSLKSLEMYELYILSRDSLMNEENQKAVIQQEYKYKYEKQAATDSITAAEASKVTNALLKAEQAENKQNKQEQYFLYAGLLIALVFGGFIYNRFKIANKQKAIIENQKQKVDKAYDGLEEAHKEITDSINYAERIQRSFLATKEVLDANLGEHFVFFQPKDVVSGDFYWAGELDNGDFALVNADSTGHGVPGAIMSILNITSIEKAIEEKATQPAEIFNLTRKTIIERLRKDGSPEGGKDGMDASLISFNKEKTKMNYVAAQNPIWIIRDGLLTEIKPEKMPVGKYDKDHIPFKGGEYDIQTGDKIYTITDGFQDQFGGLKGKKFMVKKMREYLLSISNHSMAEQHQLLREAFTSWKGDVEQVDDVCVIGVKIS